MFAIFRSLRFRLAAVYIVIFGVVVALLGMVSVAGIERYQRRYFDDQLTGRAEQMVAALVQSEDPTSEEVFRRVIETESHSIYFSDFYVQLRFTDGRTIARSDNLRIYQLPFTADAFARSTGTKFFQTLQGEEVRDLLGDNQALRMVTLRFQSPGVKPFYMQVATSLSHVESSLKFLRMLFWIGLPISLLAAAVSSWVASGRAIRRINLLSEMVRQLTPEKLKDNPVPEPQAEDEVGALVRDMKDMVDRLAAGFKAQERFIHDASHELKTPLSVLLTEAQVLQQGKPSAEDYGRFTESVAEEARHLGQLVESLLTLTRTDGQRGLSRRRLHTINDVVLSAVQECQPIADEQQVRIVVELYLADAQAQRQSAPHAPAPAAADNGELWFRGDADLMTAMVSNLLRNALRFSPKDCPVELTIEREGEEAVIRVCDQGPGIPPQVIDRIFDRFVQAPQKGPRRGTGLGLAIAKTVAELHGGRIAAQNTDEGGCCFTVHIPLAPRRPRH